MVSTLSVSTITALSPIDEGTNTYTIAGAPTPRRILVRTRHISTSVDFTLGDHILPLLNIVILEVLEGHTGLLEGYTGLWGGRGM